MRDRGLDLRGARARGAAVVVLSLALALPSTALAESYGAISGVVTEASSEKPIAGIRVCAASANIELLGEAEFEHAFGCAKTEADGTYTIGELRAEPYIVHFFASASSGLNFVPQYYEGKLLESEAAHVPVAAGETTGKIDAKLVPGARIAGRVTAAATGAPIEHAFAIVLRPTGAGHYEPITGALANANGEYLALGVPSGEAVVAFFAPGYQFQFYEGKSMPSEATVLFVVAPELTSGIDAALIPAPPEPPEGPEGPSEGGPGSSPPGAAGSVLPSVSKQSAPEGVLSLLRRHIEVRAGGRVLVRAGCSGHASCRAKLTLRVKRWRSVKGHAKLVTAEIGTSKVVSIGASHRLVVPISLNGLGRRLLREHGGSLHAELTLVTPGHTLREHVLLHERTPRA